MKKTKKTKKTEGPTWTTATGEVLLLKNMRDDHLRNAHRMLRRQPWIVPHFKSLQTLETEIARRNMQPLPVFIDSIDEAAHIVRRAAKAARAAEEIDPPGPGDF